MYLPATHTHAFSTVLLHSYCNHLPFSPSSPFLSSYHHPAALIAKRKAESDASVKDVRASVGGAGDSSDQSTKRSRSDANVYVCYASEGSL